MATETAVARSKLPDASHLKTSSSHNQTDDNMKPINTPGEYRYNPLLSSNSIRLFVMYPAEHLNAPVTGSLLQISLRKTTTAASPYDTLSYGLDSDARDHQVIVDGRRLFVSFECQVALRYLRHKSRTRTVWVDEICVDHGDEAEIVQNEARIKDVHAKARNVLVWLGEAEAKTRRALKKVVLVGRWMQFLDDHAVRHPSSDAAGVRKIWTNRIDPYKRIPSDPIPVRWFTRLWAVPEVVLDCNPLLVCGLVSIPWNHFEEWCRCQTDGNALAPMLKDYPAGISKTSSELSKRSSRKLQKRSPSQIIEARASMMRSVRELA